MIAQKPHSAASRLLRLRARPDLQARLQKFGGRRYWSFKDPLSLRYFQLLEEEYAILRMLDGEMTLEGVQAEFERRFAPRRLTPRQLQSFLAALHRDGLIVAEAPGQADELLARRQRERRREVFSSLTNILAIRLRGIDPEGLLNWLYPKVRWMYSHPGIGLWLVLVLAAVTLSAVRFGSLQARLPDFHSFFNLQNAFLLAAAIALVKVLHEFGHGLTCKHFGGECHELGLMLLVFTPCLYCNVSDSWTLPSKWRRAAISAAGMYVELLIAALATICWWFSEPGVLNSLCLNLMFVCSISTLVFNGNPLLRYDGYFILADILEVPNLAQQASAIVRRALAKWCLGVDLYAARSLPPKGRKLLAAYAIASVAYRWFVLVAILWVMNEALKPYGLQVLVHAIGLMMFVGFIGAPLWRLAAFLFDPTRSVRVNKGRLAMCVVLCGAALYAGWTLPLPYRIGAPIVIEPADARRVYVPVGGTLLTSVSAGEHVQAGQVLATLENLDLTLEIAKLTGQRNHQRLRLANLESRRVRDPAVGAQLPPAREALADLEERLKQRQLDQARLTLTAPVAGIVLPPPHRESPAAVGQLASWSGSPLDAENQGGYLETGSLFCLVGDPQRLQANLVIDQAGVEFVRAGQRVRLLLDQLPGEVLWGTIAEIAEIDLKIAPRELAAEEALATRKDASGAMRPISASYQARVELDPNQPQMLRGTAGQAKIHVDPQTLGARLERYLSRTFRLEL